jgi:hypothetical protein
MFLNGRSRWSLVLALAALLTNAACGPTSVQITQRGMAIELVGTEAAVAGCRFVGNLRARMGQNFRTYETNVELAGIDLRNQAGRKGATHLLLGEPKPRERTEWGAGCANCLEQNARAFACPAP